MELFKKEPKILSTTDYDKFIFRKDNRVIDENHVKTLMWKIEIKNMLHINPLIVNSLFEVIDGQHRLEAAKRLHIPVYYIVDDDFEREDIITLNSGRKNWVNEDYINFYASEGKEDYIKIKKFMEDHQVTSRIALIWCANPSKGMVYLSVKDGAFKFTDEEDIDENIEHTKRFLQFLKQIHFKPASININLSFHRAMKKFFSSPLVDPEEFFRQVEKCPHLFKLCISVEDYIICLCEMYNFRKQNNRLKTQIGHYRKVEIVI